MIGECSVICLFIELDGKIGIGAFKHNSFLSRSNDEVSHISALYRAKLWKDELPERETPLGVIGAAIKDNPELRKQIEDYMWEFGMEKNKDMDGVEWAQLKEEFNL